MDIGKNIKNLRRSKDMTQEELAEQLNVTVSAISQWESNKTMPDITLLPKLAIIFGVSTDEILGFSEEQNKEAFKLFKENIDSLYKERKYDEMVTLARKTMKELPNNYEVMYLLMLLYTFLEIYLFKIDPDPFYFMRDNEVQEIVGMGYGLYLPLYLLFIFVYINAYYFIPRLKKSRS